jgi:hypothetical protein
VSTVDAVGQFQGEVRATGSISKVKAGTVSDSLILAGSGGALNADVSTVYAGAGGVLNTQIRATQHVKSLTAGVAGIQNTQVTAGVGPGPDAQFGTADDLVYAGSVSAVRTTGPLRDSSFIAGENPGPNLSYGGLDGNQQDTAADNVSAPKARVPTLKADGDYAGTVLIAAGGAPGSYTLAGRRITASETSPDRNLFLVSAARTLV